MSFWEIEREQRENGREIVCGVDEAGAGPLAGPVYAAAVILPRDLEIPGLDDSKKLTEKKREALYDVITGQAEAWAVARVEAEEIDDEHIVSIENVEDEKFITVHHEMTKTHFISFAAYVTCDRMQFVKFYPEGNAETRMQFRGRGFLYIYCNKHGLMKRKV